MRTSSLLAVLLLAGCGASRAPLPRPAAERSWVPALPAPPEVAAVPALSLPPLRSFELPSGLSVQIVERRGVPVVYAALVGRGDPSGDGAAVELDRLLELALGDRGQSDDPGEQGQSARVTERGLVLTSRVLPARLQSVLTRYRAVLDGSELRDDSIARARTGLLERAVFMHGQRARSTYPPPDEELLTRFYGEGHDRIQRLRLRPPVVRQLSAREVRRHLEGLLSPSRSLLVIVGDVDTATVEQLVRARFESLAAAPSPPLASRPGPSFPEPGTRLRIHGTRDEPTAVVRLIERGPATEHEDYAAYRLFARLAGGMFSSRLNLRLRESRGETYGIVAQVVDRFDHSSLELSVVVPVGAAGYAASAIVEELARLCDPARIEPEELEIARSVELAALGASLETSTGLGRALVGAFLGGEPPSSITDTFARVAALDAAAVAAVGGRWIRPERAPMVIIGDYIWLFSHPVRVPGGVSFINE